MKALEGLVVLDLTRLLPGAVATMHLASFGAEVIKVEEPVRGDYARWMPPLIDGQGAVFTETNRGKKSVGLELKHPLGRDALIALVKDADVLIEGFRPGVMDRLKLDYETLHQHNERLIYVSLTGYGQSGPHAKLAGHDINYLSLSGVLDLIGGPEGPPAIPGVQLADLAGGAMQAVIGILLALASRARTGLGQRVNISMSDGVAALLTVPLAAYKANGHVSQRGRETLSGQYACYNVYAAKDGSWLSVGALEPKFWSTLCGALNRGDLIADQFAGEPRQSEVKRAMAEILKTRTAEEWFEQLKDRDCCVTPVRSFAEVHGKQASATGAVPQLGEHTVEVLARAGYTEAELQSLGRDKIIRT